MNLSFLRPTLWRSVSVWSLLFLAWLSARGVVWPRLERDWMSTGYSRHSGLGGGTAPIACPPHGDIALVRMIMHPMTGVCILAAGIALSIFLYFRIRRRKRTGA